MVYGGLVNKQLVARLQSLGCDALGLTGADGGLIPARKRPVRDQDFGFAGDVDYYALRADTCQSLIRIGLVPVFAPLTFDPDAGGMLNTNGDTIASALAMALSAFYSVRLIFCFDRPGVLERMEDSASVIHDLDRARFEELKSGGALHSGILPKLTAAFEAIGHGVSQVWMGEPDQLEDHLNSGPGGTLIHP
ncbi:MAG TPA: hypothetical protein VMV20_07730, partial [Chitinophagaceae bacterium]|nr:hypothetical protein [Chitinophagaceae bacterium]